jgi:diphthamide biosynthesis protein 7
MSSPTKDFKYLSIDDGQDKIPSIPSIKSITLDSNPSCVEFSLSNPEFFIIGTYQLAEGSEAQHEGETQRQSTAQSHRGSLILFSLKDDLVLHQTLDFSSGVFDLRFKPSNPNVFATVMSNGTICLCSLNIGHNPCITVDRFSKIFSSDLMSTSLAWCPQSNFQDTLAVSGSNGQIALTNPQDGAAKIRVLNQAHAMEAWVVAWADDEHKSRRPEDVVTELYSGGDDSVLYRHVISLRRSGITSYGLESPDSDAETQTASVTEAATPDAKSHTAGVTAILPLKSEVGPQLLLTGSYDDWVRLLLPPHRGRSKVLAEERLGGGVWRLKLVDSRGNNDDGHYFKVLASCMYVGVRLIEIGQSGDEWYIKILAKFVEHVSMNYASDARWLKAEDGVCGHTIVSTSFYDKKLCVWELLEH